MRGSSRGFVLLNALVLVTALAAVAVLLLSRAGEGLARRAEAQEAAQLTLYLDGFEALAITLLQRDGRSIDHLGEAWARSAVNVPVDRGRVAGRVEDLQGRFNINWLSNTQDEAAQQAFARLAQELGLSGAQRDEIIAFLTPGGAAGRRGFAQRTPPVDPVGGPVLLVDQLRLLPGLQGGGFDKLAPHIAALPADSLVNVNTASAEVLLALLPGVGPGGADRLVQEARDRPFTSLDGFIARLGAIGGFDTAARAQELTVLGVSSDWFGAEITAGLDGVKARRQTVFERRPLPLGVRVSYRQTQRD